MFPSTTKNSKDKKSPLAFKFRFNPEYINRSIEIDNCSSGRLFAYQRNVNDNRWIAKTVSTPDTEVFLTHMQEIILAFSCQHPSVLPVRGYYIEHDNNKKVWNISLKIPRMEISLQEKILEHKKSGVQINEQEIIKHFYALTCGLRYLHEKKIVHANIKPNNLLLDRHNRIKIADVGLGRFIQGNQYYSAPETADKNFQLTNKDRFKVDIWSLGLIIAELCTLQSNIIDPYGPEEEIHAKLNKLLEKIEDVCSKNLFEVVSSLLRYQPLERKSLQEIQKMLEERFPKILGVEGGFQSGDVSYRTNIKEEEEKNHDRKPNPHKTAIIFSEKTKTKWGNVFDIQKKDDESVIIQAIKSHEVNGDLIKNAIKEITLGNYEKLTGLSLDLSNCIQLDDQSVKELASEIGSRLKNLKLFVGYFTNCNKLTDEAIKDLSLKIGSTFKNLEHLDLNFFNCSQITDQGVKDLAIRIGSNFKRLEHLCLKFTDYIQVTDESITELALQIGSNLKKLNHLDLNFSSRSMFGIKKLTDRSIKELSLQIGINLQNLNYLSLNFSFCSKVTSSAFKELFSQICLNLKKLEYLNLNFTECEEMSNQSIKELAVHIKGLLDLKHLDLNFAFCKKITNQSVKELAIQIGQYLRNLKNFSLNFCCCEKLTDEALNELAIQLGPNLRQLESFCLNFDRCVQITDKSLKTLITQGISSFKDLNHLDLDFSYCKQISDEPINQLTAAIETNLKNLYSLRLCFSRCHQITEQEITALLLKIHSNFTKTKYLEMTFPAWDGFSPLVKEDIIAKLGFIPSLKISS